MHSWGVHACEEKEFGSNKYHAELMTMCTVAFLAPPIVSSFVVCLACIVIKNLVRNYGLNGYRLIKIIGSNSLLLMEQ